MNEYLGIYERGDWSQLPGTEVEQDAIAEEARVALDGIIGQVLNRYGRVSIKRNYLTEPDNPNMVTSEVYAHPPFENPDEQDQAVIEIVKRWEAYTERLDEDTIRPFIDTFYSTKMFPEPSNLGSQEVDMAWEAFMEYDDAEEINGAKMRRLFSIFLSDFTRSKPEYASLAVKRGPNDPSNVNPTRSQRVLSLLFRTHPTFASQEQLLHYGWIPDEDDFDDGNS